MACWLQIMARASRRRAPAHLIDLSSSRHAVSARVATADPAHSLLPAYLSHYSRGIASASAKPAAAAEVAQPSTSTADKSFLHPAYNEIYNRQRTLVPINHMVPDVAVDAFVAPSAVLAGGVTVDDRASIFYGCVLRADLNYIRIGAYSNLQDRVVVHAAASSPTGLSAETTVGRYVTVGQNSVLRSCEIEDEVVIGQRCLVLEGAIIEKHAVLADATVVGPGQLIPGGQLWAGNPAKFVREVSGDEIAEIQRLAESIGYTSREHASEFLPYSTAYIQAEKLKDALKTKAEKAK